MTDTIDPHSDDNAPIDAEFEPAPRNASGKKGGFRLGWLPILVLSLIFLSAIGFAAASAGLIPGLNKRATAITTLEADITDLKTSLEQANADRASLTTKLQTATTAASTQARTLHALSDRTDAAFRSIAAIETSLDEIKVLIANQPTGPVTDPDTGEPATLTIDPQILTRLDTLERAMTSFQPDTAPPTGDTLTLSEDLAAMRAEIDALNLRLETPTEPQPAPVDVIAPPETSWADAALALSAIEAAARRGQPFQIGYQQLANAMPNDARLRTLAPIAATGAATLANLQSQFPDLSRRALDAEARSIGGSAGWMRAIFGDGVTVLRSEQDNAADTLNKANVHLANNNLRAAIGQLETLDPAVQSVFTDWLDNARNRQSLEDALQALRLTMIAKDRP